MKRKFSNGFNPSWNETFIVDIREDNLEFLTFLVEDKDVAGKDHIAQRTFSIDCIRGGYRIIHLKDKNDNKIFLSRCSLFVHISFQKIK